MSKFKNILFFSTRSAKSLDFKKKMEKIQVLKIFSTDNIDEVQQIIDMSERAVILVDDEVSAHKLFSATLNKKRAHFKKFYLNWDLTLPREMRDKLFDQSYTVINSEDVDPAIERVELYLFGKINIFKNPYYVPEEDTEKKWQFKKGYFTHLEKQDRTWRILASSHETDDEINQVLGKNWDLFLENVLNDAVYMKELFETRLETAPYHELIYPHIVEGKIKKLSIVHANLDENYADKILVIHKFLQSL